jgi:hypothetical protein
LPKSVGKITYEGKETAVIFADLLDIDEGAYQMIRSAKFPYRSAEVFGLGSDSPEITSLALLEHDTPFFRLPVLTINNEMTDNESKVSLTESLFAKSYQKLNPAMCRVLFSLGGINMAEDTKKEVPAVKDEKKPDEPKKFEDMTPDEKMLAIVKRLDALEAKFANGDKKPDVKEPDKQEPTKPVEMKDGKVGQDGEIFKLKGEIEGLKGIVNGMVSKEKKKELVAKAKGELVKFNLTNIDQELEKAAEKGEDAIQHFIAGVKKVGVHDPAPSFDRFNNTSAVANDPVVMEFSAQGPEVHAKAMEACRAFDSLRGAGKTDKKTFIQMYLNNPSDGKHVFEDLKV